MNTANEQTGLTTPPEVLAKATRSGSSREQEWEWGGHSSSRMTQLSSGLDIDWRAGFEKFARPVLRYGWGSNAPAVLLFTPNAIRRIRKIRGSTLFSPPQ